MPRVTSRDVGVICLQGGNEFAADCRDMDAELLALASGPVVVVPLAGAPGREYDTAGRNGVDHFTRLGASEAAVAPDARVDEAAAISAIARAGLLVLPGGSPRRLREALVGTPVGAAVGALVASGAVVMGASAGAMLLCGWTVLPSSRLSADTGLGLVPDFGVLPHYSGPRPRWLAALRERAPHLDVLGIPECSGVLIDGEDVRTVGAAPTTLLTPDGELHTLAR